MTRELQRKANNLSADAKQKISLGRGLVRKDVAAILFDEPLTVIDPHLKWVLRRQLKKIHQQLKLTLIYVTHDQVEALTFADEVVVMTQRPRRAERRSGSAVCAARSRVRRLLHRQSGDEPLSGRAGRRRSEDRRATSAAGPAHARYAEARERHAEARHSPGVRARRGREPGGRGEGPGAARAAPRQLPAGHRAMRRPHLQGQGRTASALSAKGRSGCNSPRRKPCSSATTKGSRR